MKNAFTKMGFIFYFIFSVSVFANETSLNFGSMYVYSPKTKTALTKNQVSVGIIMDDFESASSKKEQRAERVVIFEGDNTWGSSLGAIWRYEQSATHSKDFIFEIPKGVDLSKYTITVLALSRASNLFDSDFRINSQVDVKLTDIQKLKPSTAWEFK